MIILAVVALVIIEFDDNKLVIDAGMGERAECMMWNKGPYVVLRRLHDHRAKKVALLRTLNLSGLAERKKSHIGIRGIRAFIRKVERSDTSGQG